MNPALLQIIAALGEAGLTDLFKDFLKRNENDDKMKLKIINILVKNMDDDGKCDVKDIIKELVENESFFSFGDRGDE